MQHTIAGRFRRLAVLAATSSLVLAGVTLGLERPAEASSLVGITGRQTVAPAGTAERPSAASNGIQTLTVWQQRVNGTSTLYGRIVASDGSSQGPRITIHSTPGRDAVDPDVAWVRTHWVVVYDFAFSATDHDIYAVPVSTTGEVGAWAVVVTTTADQHRPAVATTPGGNPVQIAYSVAYEEGAVGDPTSVDVYLAEAKLDGTITARVRMSNDTTDNRAEDREPDVTWNSESIATLVVWESQGEATSSILYGLTSDFGGRSTTVRVAAHQERAQPLHRPAVAACPFWFAIVYENVFPGSTGTDIWASVLTDDYTTPLVPVSHQPGDESDPVVACNFNDRQFLVAWTDRRSDPNGDIRGTRIEGTTVTDPNGFALATGSTAQTQPAVTGGGVEERFGAAWTDTTAGQGPRVLYAGLSVAPK
jgi:hypothetical protein